MAPRTRPSGSSRPGRVLLAFAAVLALMYGLVAFAGDWKPRLGLDLQGGTRLTMQAQTTEDTGDLTQEKMNEAVDIIRQRVNGTGVTEAEVSTQGGDQIVVEVPGEERGELAEQVGQTAQLRFRLVHGQPVPGAPTQQQGGQSDPQGGQSGEQPEQQPGSQAPQPEESGAPAEPNGSESPANNRAAPMWAAQGDASPDEAAPDNAAPDNAAPDNAAPDNAGSQETPQPQQQGEPSDLEGSELLDWQPSPQLNQRFQEYTCPPPGEADDQLVDNPDRGLITCDDNGYKYLLSPSIIEGTELADASSGIPTGGGAYVVQLEFDSGATDVFADVTERLNGTGQQFAIVLDGRVLSAPTVSNGAIRTGQAEISGNFTQESASALANSLKYGVLPLSFTTQGVSVEGPELADDALQAGVIAGAIGLLLVLVYCLLYYRALGLVVVSSLLVAAAGVYASVLLLSETMGFTLTLPGVAGLIVAIGITADSFIVFFERLRDEVRDGKSLLMAVEAGWNRAKRTILAADTVTLLAALVLYIFAIGSVKGFAFALGLTTLIDVLVVFFFTKPMVTLLAGSKFFRSGHKLSGLDPRHLGVERIQGTTPVRQPAGRGA